MANKKVWTEEDVLKIMNIVHMTEPLSFSEPVNNSAEDNASELGEFILDDGPGPQEFAEIQDRNRILKEAVKLLKPREQAIIEMRYGLNDGIFRTLDECGNKFGVGRERIRQIETKAIRNLRWILRCKYKLKETDL